MHKRATMLVTGVIGMSILLTGCFQGESQENIDPPQGTQVNHDNDQSMTNDNNKAEKVNKDTDDTENETKQMVERKLFLMDANGMVAPQTIDIPQADSMAVATQALQYLVKGGPVTNLLPNGFQAVLPSGTEILGLDLQKDGTMIVDLSKEFTDYKSENELSILQALTYTLTQFDTVNKVKLRVDGKALDKMPVNGTPIKNGYTRDNGINVTDTDTSDIIGSDAVTMYYPTQYKENEYFVPVTQYLHESDQDHYASVVNALINGPAYSVHAKTVFNDDVALVNEPNLDDDGVLELDFNKNILKNADDTDNAVLADDVMETLVRTMTAGKDVKAVKVNVEDVEKVFNEEGKSYDKPVTAATFTPKKKL